MARVAVLVVALALLGAVAVARAEEDDAEGGEEDTDMDVLGEDGTSLAEVAADARFPMTHKFERYVSGCMDVNRAICLGHPRRKAGKGKHQRSCDGKKKKCGVFAIHKDGMTKGLIGHWTFDDVLCQDHSGYMDPLYPTPGFGPGFNGGTSAYFNGTVLHWISPSRTRPAYKLTKRAAPEREFSAKQRAKAEAEAKRKGKKDHRRRQRGRDGKKKKHKRPPGVTDSLEAAMALAQTEKGRGDVSHEDLTIAFWVYLLNDVVGNFRTLVYRGDAEAATPHISLWPEYRRIHLRVSTGMDPVTGKRTHISLDSHSAVLIGRWTHIAFVVQGTRLAQLYVNGVLDTQKLSLQPIKVHHTSDMVYLANNPFAANSGMECYLDSLSIYNRALPRGQVTAMGSAVLPGVDASSVKLGCASCTLQQAQSTCKVSHGSHVCTETELHSGALVIARAMGWMNSMVGVHVFTGEELTHKPAAKKDDGTDEIDAVVLGAGLCCRDT